MNGATITGNVDGSVECLTVFDFHQPDAEGKPWPVRVRLSWSPRDPVSVQAHFPTSRYSHDRAEDVVWRFARDLLVDGLLFSAGCGDVRVIPAAGGQLRIIFDNQSGHADFSTDVATIQGFLAETFYRCPIGCEFARFDMDAALEDLLSEWKWTG